MRRVAVTGASGFVGRALVRALVARGNRVIALGRHPGAFEPDRSVEARRYDPNETTPNPAAFKDTDAVINLAGESVAGRWTAEKKARIYASRVAGTRNLVASLAQLERRPAVLVNASASGYYGDRCDEVLTEQAAPGDDFLANVCFDWEEAAARAEDLGVRVVPLRTGLVLGKGGALAEMLPPFRFGLGGPFGGGRQFVPWIHLDDLVALYLFALGRSDVRGPLNAVAPDYATSARFAQALGGAVGRPALVPAPGPALRLLLGEFGNTLLGGQVMLPAAASDAGFEWRHGSLEQALIDVVADGMRRPAVRSFQADETVQAGLEAVFAFFSDARNLAVITPPEMAFSLRSEPLHMGRGTVIDYRLRVRGFPVRWKTLITEWDPPHGFVDVQMHGPYALWRHRHRFDAVEGGVRIRDEVEYALPFLPFGNLAAAGVSSDVQHIFEYRSSAIRGRFTRMDQPVTAAYAE